MSKASQNRFVTLSELVEMLGMSTATFYKFQKQGVFPAPLRTQSNRPVFDQNLIDECQQIVRTRVGKNGLPVIFSVRKKKGSETIQKRQGNNPGKHDEMIGALASLGLTATPQQVEEAIKELPVDLPTPELIRRVFLQIRKTS